MGGKVHSFVNEKGCEKASKSNMVVKHDSKTKKDHRWTYTNPFTFIIIYMIGLKIR